MNYFKLYKTNIIRTIIAIISIAIFSACSDDNNGMGEIDTSRTGSISLNAIIDPTISNAISRASEDLSQLTESQRKLLTDLASSPATNLSVRLESSDGTVIKEWTTVNEFIKETEFAVGKYTISVWHGDFEKEEFNSPYFFASTEVYVNENETASVNLAAKLKNSLVGIDRTEKFEEYFDGFNAALTTAKGTVLNFGSEDTKDAIAYIQPGKVTLNVTVSLDGKVATVPVVTDFTALEASLQKIRLDVENTPETIILSVKFIGIEETEDIDIDITDKFELAEAPSLLLDGFDSATPLNIYEGNSAALEAKYRFNIEARGKMSAVTLKVESPILTKDFNLFDAQDVAELTDSYGVKVLGIEENSMYGYVDITSWIPSLQVKDASSDVETTVFTLVVEDSHGQQCTENNTFAVNIYPERAILLSSYAEDELVPADNMTFTLYTTIDNLEEKTNRISLTTDNHNYGEESLSFSVEKVVSDKTEYPFCYTLTVPTPAYKLDFYVKGQTSNGRSCGEPINLHRPVPEIEVTLPENEITTETVNIYVDIKFPSEKGLLCRIIEESKLYVKVDDKEISILPSDFVETRAIVFFDQLNDDTEYSWTYTYIDYTSPVKTFRTGKRPPKIILDYEELDIYAHYATIHIKLEDTDRIAEFIDNVKNGKILVYVKDNGEIVKEITITDVEDASDGDISIFINYLDNGNVLSSGTPYDIEIKNDTEVISKYGEFTTEEETIIPCGKFNESDWSSSTTGSQYQILWRLNDNIWNTNNETTANAGAGSGTGAGAAYRATSGTKPDNGRALIRTVGYGQNNTPFLIRASDLTRDNDEKCTNTAPGLLETNGTGVLISRAKELKFTYKYSPKNNDKWYYHIIIRSETNEILNEYESSIAETAGEISLSINSTLSKQCYLYVYISSTHPINGYGNSYVRNNFDYPSAQKAAFTGDYTAPMEAEFVGSQLWIENLVLIYNQTPND
ncbi:MAG: DUF4493 domain-containing protein [Muribaculaceae bacterium]|nr:DUF4493 domain-containing protein [Muribaculaceae bacterium]